MLCDTCRKRQATVFLHLLAGNKLVEKTLCHQCAEGDEAAVDPTAALLELLGSLSPSRTKVHPARCPRCETTFAQFKAKGRFGCAECYAHFEAQVRSLVPRVHAGAYQHRGKRPRGAA